MRNLCGYFFKKKVKPLTEFEIVVMVIALICFFEPQLFKISDAPAELLFIDNCYKVLKLLFGTISLVIYLRKIGLSKLFLALLAFQMVTTISTFVNQGNLIRFIGPATTTLFMVAITEALVKTHNFFKIAPVLLWYFRILFTINFLSIPVVGALKQNGFTPPYFLGIDNRWIFTYFPWVLLELLYSLKKENSINKSAILAWTGSTVTLFYTWSAAAAICQLLWLILLFPKLRKFLTSTIYPFFAVIILDFSITIFRVHLLFRWVLSSAGKGMTISGRTFLWDGVLKSFCRHPIFGQGMQSTEYDKNFFASTHDYELPYLFVSHAHNSIMTILYRFGIFAVLVYLYLYYICFNSLVKNKSSFASVIYIALIIALVLSIFDTFDCAGLYMAMALAYSVRLVAKHE